jgi:hypothetical protein
MQLCVPLYCITHLCPAHTTSGRVRLNLALDQKTVDFLRETAQGERGISEVIEDLAQERRTLGPIHARLERMTASYVALVRMLQLARITPTPAGIDTPRVAVENLTAKEK